MNDMVNANDATRAFLEKVYDLSASNRREASALVMDYLDDHQIDGRFDLCDKVFSMADPARLEPTVIIGFLGITLRAAKEGRLPSRAAFADRVASSLKDRGWSYCRITELLSKYR